MHNLAFRESVVKHTKQAATFATRTHLQKLEFLPVFKTLVTGEKC